MTSVYILCGLFMELRWFFTKAPLKLFSKFIITQYGDYLINPQSQIGVNYIKTSNSMEQQQSFHNSLLSNATIYDRMFRSKPYTKCINCLSNDKLKCRSCMQNIIDEISRDDGKKKTIRIRNVSSNLLSRQLNTSYKKEEKEGNPGMKKSLSVTRFKGKGQDRGKENVMITSKYNWWMAQRIKKRQTDVDLKSTWPRKIKFNDVNLEHFGVKHPKFQKWEKKLLDKFLIKKKSTPRLY